MKQVTTAGVLASAVAALTGTVFVDTGGSPPARRLGTGTVTVDLAAPGAAIPPTLYGIFFEEINHAGDGGLYAELVRNRGFEDANLPPACTREDGFVVPPRTPHFDTGKPNDWRLRWDVTSPHPNWTLDATGGAEATIALTADAPLNDATPHSLAVTIARPAAAGGRIAVVNDGYWGMSITAGAEYLLTFFARTDGSYAAPIAARLEGASGTVLAEAALDLRNGQGPADGWRRFRAGLKATATDPKARLAISFNGAGRVWLDMVSLFPAKTFKDRPNGLRPDLAQMIADLRPGFIRAPGGCFAEGITVESRPQWKRTLAPIEDRPGT